MGGSLIYDEYGGFKSYLRKCVEKSLKCFDAEKLLQSLHEVILDELGIDVHIWSRKTSGVVCSCWNDLTGESNGSCEACYGTGFAGGYDEVLYEDTEIIKMRVANPQRALELTEFGYNVGVTIKGQLSKLPETKNRDLVYWISRGLLFELYNHTPIFYAEEITRQEFSLKLLQGYEVAHKLEEVV